MATTVEELQNIIATSTDPDNVELAKKRLEAMASVGSAQVQLAANSGISDPAALAIITALQNAIVGGSFNMSDFRKRFNEELEIRKIKENDLSTSLLALINSSRSVNLTVSKLFGVNLTQSVKSSMLERPLTQMILTDLMARNNVYLYGGAGTGKTYMAVSYTHLTLPTKA